MRDRQETQPEGTVREQERYSHGYSAGARWMATRTGKREAAFFLPYLRPGMSLLDCGCGPGTITIGLAKAVAPGQVLGIDTAADQIEEAKAFAVEHKVSNVSFQTASIYHIPFENESYDAVFAHAVLEHLKQPLKALKEMQRVLKPGGVVGLRHSDFSEMLYFPRTTAFRRGKELIERRWRHNGGDPDLGKKQRALLWRAGFSHIEASASYENFGVREATRRWAELWSSIMTETAFVDQVVELGWADRLEIENLSAAWRAWAEHPDAFSALPWCEAVAWKE